MAELIQMQPPNYSDLDQGKLCRFDLEAIDAPTSPLIHQAARFIFINAGEGVLRVQNVDYPLQPGSFVSILPWQITQVTEVSKPLQYFILVYRYDTIVQAIRGYSHVDDSPFDIAQKMSENPVLACNKEEAERIRSILLSIRDEVGIESSRHEIEPQALSGIYVANALVEMIVLHTRIGLGGGGTAKTKKPIDRSEILRYMYNHLGEKLTLKMLSQIFYMSESSISQYITQMTGLSFFDLLNEMRVGKTINFLLYTDLTLEELAEILGYVDASHISKVFAARVGMKANEYRKTYQRVSGICKVKESKKAYAIVDYLFNNYAEPLSPQKLADQFGIGVQELHRVLLYQTGKNFEDFLNYIRVNRASELLLTTDKSIVDIAIEVGYNTSKTLTRNFLKLRVMTPNDFRKHVKLQPSEFLK